MIWFLSAWRRKPQGRDFPGGIPSGVRGDRKEGRMAAPLSLSSDLSAGCGSAGSDCGSGSAHGSRCSARSGFRSGCGSSPSCCAPPFPVSGRTPPGRCLFCPESRKEIPKRRKNSRKFPQKAVDNRSPPCYTNREKQRRPVHPPHLQRYVKRSRSFLGHVFRGFPPVQHACPGMIADARPASAFLYFSRRCFGH